MHLNWRFIQFASWKRDGDSFIGSGFWIRIFGREFHVTNGSLYFSERNGYKKFIKLPFGYRLCFFKDKK